MDDVITETILLKEFNHPITIIANFFTFKNKKKTLLFFLMITLRTLRSINHKILFLCTKEIHLQLSPRNSRIPLRPNFQFRNILLKLNLHDHHL